MVSSMQADINRFKQIVRGRVRKDLRRFMSQGEMIGRKGKDLVSIPLPQIDIPKFKYGPKQTGGVGQGEGEPGQPVGPGDEPGEAGNAAGKHILEVEMTMDELAELLGDELSLPKIEPKGTKNIVAQRTKYNGISQQGPESLRHFRRTYRRALQRQIAAGNYDPKNPVVIPIKEDRVYRTWKVEETPDHNAVVIYMMDVSGSMGNEQKEIVRTTAFWIDTWLQSQYQDVESRFIIHDAVAREVDRDTFFRTRESGGTLISSAYKLAQKIITEDYPPSDWNIYPFHFSDGDNWSSSDTRDCLQLLEKFMFPSANVFCYGQVESEYGSGQFMRDLTEKFPSNDDLLLAKIDGKDHIYDAIKVFLGTGK